MGEPCEPGSPESLRRHLNWLYGPDGVYPGNVPCKCKHGFESLGRVNGVNIGKEWLRVTTHPDCPHHGTKASKERVARAKARRKAPHLHGPTDG